MAANNVDADTMEIGDLQEDAVREARDPSSSEAAQLPTSTKWRKEYDYVLIYIQEDTVGVANFHKELQGHGLEGCLYNDPSIIHASVTWEMEVHDYACEHSTVCVLYMSQTVCNAMKLFSVYGDEMLKQANYAALYKCLNDKNYNNFFIPYYPTTKSALKDVPFNIAPIAGLEAKSPYYGTHLCAVFGLLSYDGYKSFRPNKSHPVQKKKAERLERHKTEMERKKKKTAFHPEMLQD